MNNFLVFNKVTTSDSRWFNPFPKKFNYLNLNLGAAWTSKSYKEIDKVSDTGSDGSYYDEENLILFGSFFFLSRDI